MFLQCQCVASCHWCWGQGVCLSAGVEFWWWHLIFSRTVCQMIMILGEGMALYCLHRKEFTWKELQPYVFTQILNKATSFTIHYLFIHKEIKIFINICLSLELHINACLPPSILMTKLYLIPSYTANIISSPSPTSQ